MFKSLRSKKEMPRRNSNSKMMAVKKNDAAEMIKKSVEILDRAIQETKNARAATHRIASKMEFHSSKK
jgi:hypothetical protein